VGVTRQYAGVTGQVGNCQTVVVLANVTARAYALVDFLLYLPECWANDTTRREEAGVRPGGFATKPQLAIGPEASERPGAVRSGLTETDVRRHACCVDQRHEWFKEGARAFRSVLGRHGRAHLLPSDIDLYPCPLCLRGLYAIEAIEAGELTREHVPPHSLGGRWLALTCRACNNDAGTFYDAEAEKQERMRSFLTGQHQGLMRGTYTVNGVSHRGEMHLAPMLSDGPAPIEVISARE
jgi:hypothetical protein